MKLAEILTGPEKWMQDEYERNGRVCLVGALGKLLSRPPDTIEDDDPEYQRLSRAISDETGRPCDGVHNWNDMPERTFTEIARVAAAYDRRRMLNT